jgi:hypothetical protein
LFIALYPLLDLLKVYVRMSDSVTLSGVIEVLDNGLSASNFGWFDSLQQAGEKIIGRVQLISHAVFVKDNMSFFGAMSESALNPFWKEGIQGVIIARLNGEQTGAEAGQALASFIAPNLESGWNVNPSLVGWLGMHFDTLPLAIAYVIFLCFVSTWLHQQLTSSEASFDRLWFIWLTMLIPGWIAQFVSIILAQAIFLVVARSIGATSQIEKTAQYSHTINQKMKGTK